MQNDDAEHDFTEGKYQNIFCCSFDLTLKQKYEMEQVILVRFICDS